MNLIVKLHFLLASSLVVLWIRFGVVNASCTSLHGTEVQYNRRGPSLKSAGEYQSGTSSPTGPEPFIPSYPPLHLISSPSRNISSHSPAPSQTIPYEIHTTLPHPPSPHSLPSPISTHHPPGPSTHHHTSSNQPGTTNARRSHPPS